MQQKKIRATGIFRKRGAIVATHTVLVAANYGHPTPEGTAFVAILRHGSTEEHRFFDRDGDWIDSRTVPVKTRKCPICHRPLPRSAGKWERFHERCRESDLYRFNEMGAWK